MELLLAGPAGRAEARAGADALAAVGAEDGVVHGVPACLRMEAMGITCGRWTRGHGWSPGPGGRAWRAGCHRARAGRRRRRRRRPQHTRRGAPKILLAFDASGSMLTNDGNGTREDRRREGCRGRAAVHAARFDARSGCGSTGGRCRRGRSARRAGTRSSCCRSAASIAARRKSRSARSTRAGAPRSPTRSSRPRSTSAPAAGARSCSSPTARTPASRPRRADVRQRDREGRRGDAHPGDRAQRRRGVATRSSSASRPRAAACTATRPTPRPARGAAGALHPRPARVHRRAARRSRAAGRPPGHGDHPRPATTDKMLPDSERWYAVDLKRGETLKASQSLIPPERNVGRSTAGHGLVAGHRDAGLRHPGRGTTARRGRPTPFQRRGFVDGLGVVSPPDRRRQPRPSRGRRVRETGALLPQAQARRTPPTRRSTTRPAGSRYTSEMAVEMLGRGRDEKPAKTRGQAAARGRSITPEEPPSSALLAGRGRRTRGVRASRPARSLCGGGGA